MCFSWKSKEQQTLNDIKGSVTDILNEMEGYYTNDSKMDEFDKTEMNFYMTMLRNTINQIQKMASLSSKSLTPNATNRKLSVTLGSWALPYLKLLKQIGLAK